MDFKNFMSQSRQIRAIAEFYVSKIYDGKEASNLDILRDLNMFMSYVVIVCARSTNQDGKHFLEMTKKLYEEKQPELMQAFKGGLDIFIDDWDDD